MSSFEITEISRKLANIIRIGKIIEADYNNAKVRVKIGKLITNWLSFAAPRAANVTIWNPPQLNEQVIVISPDGDLSQGVVLPSLYQDAFPQISTMDTDTIIKFADGSVLKYDSSAKELTATLTTGGKATVTASGGITITGDLTITGNITSTGKITNTGDLEVTGKITSTGDQIAGTISQISHKHNDSLGSPTSEPV